MDVGVEEEGDGGMDWKSVSGICALPEYSRQQVEMCCMAQGTPCSAPWWPKEGGWGNGSEALEEGHICIHICIYISWVRNWNQGCWEKYQQPQIRRWYHSNGRKQRGTKEPLDDERGDWKSWLKNQHSKTKIMASSPITSWQIEEEKVESVTDFLFLGSKITAGSDCNHEIRRLLFLGRKATTNLDSILKNIDSTLLTKVHIVKAMVFPVVMYGCESWIIKEGWALKNWCFQIVILEKTLESPLDNKEIKPVNPKGHQPWKLTGRTGAETEAPILWLLDVESSLDSLDKTLMLGKIEGRRRRQQRMWWLDTISSSMDMNLGELQEIVRDRKGWCVAIHGVTKSQTWLSAWTKTT